MIESQFIEKKNKAIYTKIFTSQLLGFLAYTNNKTSLPLLRQLINPDQEFTEKLSETVQKIMLRLTGVDVTLCPECGQGTMVCVESLPAQGLDTS